MVTLNSATFYTINNIFHFASNLYNLYETLVYAAKNTLNIQDSSNGCTYTTVNTIK